LTANAIVEALLFGGVFVLRTLDDLFSFVNAVALVALTLVVDITIFSTAQSRCAMQGRFLLLLGSDYFAILWRY
jgi:hypothetical protein